MFFFLVDNMLNLIPSTEDTPLFLHVLKERKLLILVHVIEFTFYYLHISNIGIRNEIEITSHPKLVIFSSINMLVF